MLRFFYFVIAALMLQGCLESFQETPIVSEDINDAYRDVTYTLEGRIVDENRLPLAGATIMLLNQQLTAQSDANGSFAFDSLAYRNDYIHISQDGYYDALHTLQAAESNATVTYPAIELSRLETAKTRFLFTGDVSLARRFMDPAAPARSTELITTAVTGAVLEADNIYESGQKVIHAVQPLFDTVDYPVVNFESVVTDTVTTLNAIHPTKDFAYYSKPESLELIKALGINFATLGNNHLFDYQADGVNDTLNAFDSAGIRYSGVGLDVAEAFTPFRTLLNQQNFSFSGATSILGDKHDVLYVAHENSGIDDPYATQGGAANAHDALRVSTLLQDEKAQGYFPIYQLHGGIEYTFSPNSTVLGLMTDAVDNGAGLVISHHPHSAQGYSLYNNTLIAHGLGNFIFDQDRLDTFLSHILVCDITDGNLTHAIGYPIYIEGYVPKLLSGDLANRFIRQISEVSRNGSPILEAPLPSDLMIYPYHFNEYFSFNGDYETVTHERNISVTIPASGEKIVDLRHLSSSEASLSQITSATSALNVTMGRDLLLFGEFEDNDVDEAWFENDAWGEGSSYSPSPDAHSGLASMAIYRNSDNEQSALLTFGKRIRVMGDARNHPNKALSLYGHLKADNSGPFTVATRYYASIDENEFGQTAVYSGSGTHDWKEISAAIPLPADEVDSTEPAEYLTQNARALKIYINLYPPEEGQGNLKIDDLAVVNWEENATLSVPMLLDAPHAREFLKITGPEGTHSLRLEFTSFRPVGG